MRRIRLPPDGHRRRSASSRPARPPRAPTGLTIAGGGLDEPLEVDVTGETMEAIVEQTHFYDSLWEPGVHALTSAAPSRHLGPRVVLSWDMDHDGSALGPDVPFVQTVYPLARGGPIVHTDDGQQVYWGRSRVAGTAPIGAWS